MYVCDVYAQYVYIISNIYVFLWKTTRRRSEYAHPSNRLGYEINTFRPGAIGDQRSSSGVAFSSSIVVIHPETWLFFFFFFIGRLFHYFQLTYGNGWRQEKEGVETKTVTGVISGGGWKELCSQTLSLCTHTHTIFPRRSSISLEPKKM